MLHTRSLACLDRYAFLATLAGLLLAFLPAQAQGLYFVWSGNGDAHSWDDPRNWDSTLVYPGSLRCLDIAIIPNGHGYHVDIDNTVTVSSVMIGEDASVTVLASGTFATGLATGAGRLINHGIVTTACALETEFGSELRLEDNADAFWVVYIGGKVRFDHSATELQGDFVILSSLSTITLGANVLLMTEGDYFYPDTNQCACDFLLAPSSSVFSWGGPYAGACPP